MKKLVVISDLHCGHRSGLTPTAWQLRDHGGFLGKVARFQKELFSWFKKEMKLLGDIDMLVCNGDAIDGKGKKSGGTEIIESDRNGQVNMAVECIKQCKAKKILVINGTPYHTGMDEDWEYTLAEKLNADYANHEFISCDGVIFDFRHQVGSSSIPHGRFTTPRRAALWNILKHERSMEPKATILVRSHVHYYTCSDDDYRTVITTPSLQGWSKFGSRICDGSNSIGFLSFECLNGNSTMTKHMFEMKKFSSDAKEV